jgi:parvulin-like peptidyl-prolyl isomerase
MLDTMRKIQKYVMWIVAVTFIGTIVFSWGMGGFKSRQDMVEKGIIGNINGEPVMVQQFQQLVEEEYRKAREQEKADDLNEYRRSMIRDQVWQNLVRERLLAQEVVRQGLEATPQEVVYYMRNYPPDFVRSGESFQTDGSFDAAKYRQALSDPQYTRFWIPLESYFKSMIPVQKLQQTVIAGVRVSDAEVLEAYRMENEKVNVKAVFFDPTKTPLEDPLVSESAVKRYYGEHEKEYEEPEQRRIQYVLFSIQPSREDSAQTLSDATDIMNQIREGVDFTQLAKDLSEDKSNADKGGDLGFFGRGAMVKPFEDAAFAAKPGEVVGPVQTPFGLHVIKVVAKKQEKGEMQVQASHILLTFKASQETQEAAAERADFFIEEVSKTKGKAFKEIAVRENLTSKESPLFRKSGFIPGVGLSPRANNLAFQAKKGWVSPAVYVDKNVLVFQVIEIQPLRIKPLADVKDAIRNALQAQKRKAAALRAAKQFSNEVKNPLDFETLALKDSLSVFETGFFSALSYIPQIGSDATFSGAAFRLKPDEISPPVETDRGVYMIKLVARMPMKAQAFESEKAAYRQTVLQKKQNRFYSAWIKSLVDHAKIKDFREMYY